MQQKVLLKNYRASSQLEVELTPKPKSQLNVQVKGSWQLNKVQLKLLLNHYTSQVS